MVSPLRLDSHNNRNKVDCNNKENTPLNKNEVNNGKLNYMSDASSQTEEAPKVQKELSLPSTNGSFVSHYNSGSSCSSSSGNGSNCSSSSTEISLVINGKANLCNGMTQTSYTGRQKTQAELECEELSRDLVKQLPQGDRDKLHVILGKLIIL